ncbi:MAG: prepilin-type N-terminal cleavage/methylation domain-containing protein [Acidobacteria bacterium]|nr:prepilin-type N-terminal cleavage/methylation domain-containing protein [Acidobacteriota bacterium]MBI3488232.1 prepilin-type N-terminal cleavage/methylation domain-containing protein [Acidobacteriota bacterium]
MMLQSFRRVRPLQHGFSLIEMLVAVMFIGILSAGMMRIYSANLSGFQRVNDTIASQRRGRWALSSLQDDVASVGFFAFVPFNQPAGYSVVSGSQEPFMILPSPTAVSVTGPDPTNPTVMLTANLSPNPDELQFVGDIPLPIQATVLSTSGTALGLNVSSGNMADIEAGDIVAILDPTFEQVKVATKPSSTTLSISATGASEQASRQVAGYALSPTLSAHAVGVPVVVFRPNVVTRYSIQARAWDPSNAGTIPCLVRQQTPYPDGGALIDWTGVQADVIAENIDGFRVDISFDGGTTWLRQAAGSWDAIVSSMQGLSPGGVVLNPRDASNPLWYRNFPCLIRMDITARSAAPKAANSDITGQAAYVRRTQTLMVTPRNFGLPLF